MQRVKASVILGDAYGLMRWDPEQLEEREVDAARRAFSRALQQVWEAWFWNFLMVTGTVAFEQVDDGEVYGEAEPGGVVGEVQGIYREDPERFPNAREYEWGETAGRGLWVLNLEEDLDGEAWVRRRRVTPIIEGVDWDVGERYEAVAAEELVWDGVVTPAPVADVVRVWNGALQVQNLDDGLWHTVAQTDGGSVGIDPVPVAEDEEYASATRLKSGTLQMKNLGDGLWYDVVLRSLDDGTPTFSLEGAGES